MHLVMMLALTFTTGIVDAVGYLGLDRVFTANMTGNVVILGMALTGATDLPVLGPTVALLAFTLGAGLGGLALRGARTGWSGRSSTIFALVGVVLLATGGGSWLRTPVEGTGWGVAVTALIGLAMGAQAAAARRLSVADVTTVVVTSTLVGLASESRLAGGTGKNAPRRLLAVLLIGFGAAAGALLLRVDIALGLAVAGVLTLAVALLGHVARERVTTGSPTPRG